MEFRRTLQYRPSVNHLPLISHLASSSKEVKCESEYRRFLYAAIFSAVQSPKIGGIWGSTERVPLSTAKDSFIIASDTVKDLGVLVSADNSWSPHIIIGKMINSARRRAAWVLNALRSGTAAELL